MIKKSKVIKNTILACTVAGIVTISGITGDVAEAAPAGNSAATMSTTSVSKLSYNRTLRYGAKGNDVLDLQRALKHLGYYSYNIGGGFGPGMEASVIDFQKSQGIPVDGSAGPKTIRTINSVLNGSRTAKGVSQLTYKRALRYGMSGNDVLDLQRALKQLGYYKHNVGGGFGPAVKQAVLSFQRAQGISVDGSAGSETIKTINSVLNGSRTAKGVSQLTYKRALRYGMSGNDVLDLQRALKQLGHYKHNIGGGFGPAVRQAVLDFQSTQGISVDGSAGPKTVKTINGVLSGKIKAGTPSRGSVTRSVGTKIIKEAKKHIGGNYVFGGSSPSGFDCSGFTNYVYKKAGISIPRTTGGQASAGKKVSKSNLQVGDLLIFSNTYKNGPSHAGVYLGNGKFVHAANPRKGIRVDSINSGYYNSKFSYGRRVF